MSVTVDHLNQFQPEIESIDEFIERFKVQNSVKLTAAAGDSKQRAMLLINCLPVKVVTDVQRRIKPLLLSDATYDDIESNLLAGYQVKKSIIGAAVNFLTRKQRHDESIESYAKILNELASHCSYSDCCRDRMLRDVFISGLRSSKLMQHLMTECEKKKYKDVVEKAKVFEQVSQDVEDIKPSTRDHSTYKVNPVSSKKKTNNPSTSIKPVPSDYICIRCGTQATHYASKCYALNITCNSCGKTGHISKACRSKSKPTFKKTDSTQSKYVYPEEEDASEFLAMNTVLPEPEAVEHRTSVSQVDPIVPLYNKYDNLGEATADSTTLQSQRVHTLRKENDNRTISNSFLDVTFN